jgi:hypothetical protein
MFLNSTGLTSVLVASLYIALDWEAKLKCLLTNMSGQMTDNQERMQAEMQVGQEGHYVTIVIQVTMDVTLHLNIKVARKET